MADAATTALDDDALLTELKRLQPVKVLAVLKTGGDPRPIAVHANSRKRWLHLQRTLTDVDWARLECLNAKGELVGVIHEGGAQPEDRAEAPKEYAFLGITREIIKTVLSEFRETTKDKDNLIMSLAGATMERLNRLESAWSSMVQQAGKAQMQLARAQAATVAGDPVDSTMQHLMEMYMAKEFGFMPTPDMMAQMKAMMGGGSGGKNGEAPKGKKGEDKE